MRQRSREINVFSVSALDLFASALGAFILMSVIFMVFFAMTARESGTAEAVPAAADGADEALAQCQNDLMQCRADVAKLEGELDAVEVRGSGAQVIPPLDLVICLDITGSMRDEIAALKSQVTDLVRVLDGLAESVGIGIVVFGDIEYDRVTHEQPVTPTSSMASLRAFVDSIELRMGVGSGSNDDLPEAVDTALRQAVRMNWRPESELRYIVVITDAPAYAHKEAAAFEKARAFASGGNQHVSAVMVGGYDAEHFLTALARAGQGQFVDSVGGQSMIANVLLAIVST